MSFPPPGPPMPMPGMPPVPPMMPPPYHPVPPMGGMIPMTVGMMPAPMMAPVAMAVPPTLPMPPHPKSPMKKHMPPMPYKRHEWMNKLREYNKKGYSTTLQSQTPKGPPVTVFVGNITERASDSLIRQILQRCGTVVNWKRVQGANGKLQAFGFCEYGDPESGLRAIRLLHEWQIGEKKLVVKVDAKTKEKLDEYKATKWANQNKETTAAAAASTTTEKGEEKKDEETDDKNDEIDENTKKEDLIIKGSIEDILRDHSVELSRPVESKDTDTVEPENHMGWLNSFSDKRILKSYQLRKLFTLSQTNSTTNKETPPVEKPRKSSTKSQETSSKSREDNPRESKNGLDEMDLEEEKKSLIHREIDKFRDTYKLVENPVRVFNLRAEEEKEKERERKERDSSRESSRSRHREYRDKERKSSSRRERTPVRERERDREAERARERERERTRSPVERIRGKDKIERIMARSRSRSRDRAWSQERERSSRERSRDKDVDKDREDEEDAYDRKKMDRKLREKEAAYQERLRNWEQRERRKAKDYEKSRQKEDDQKQEELKEARRLKEFLEDYDDERDDPKYYKGSALARRLKEREKEIEADNHDRRKEKEELEELRRQLVEKGHPDPDGELERLHQEEQAKLLQSKAKVEPSDSEGEPEPVQLPKMKPIVKQEVVEEETKPAPTKHPLEDENTQNSLSGFSDVITTQEEAKPLGFGVLRLGGSPTQVTRSPSTTTTTTTTSSTQSGQKKKISLQDVFNDDDSGEQRKKRKLIPLDDVLEEESAKLTGTSQQNMSTEEKRKHIKNLIDKIPTAKEELFAFTLDWSLVDKPLMERKIKPWINKKIVEYIGEEEPTLVDFICSKVLAGSAAQSILDDVSMVLDEEAEVFVVKMWRLLIYEIEAKKLGLMR